METTTRRLLRRGEPVAIEPTPFDLLVLLIASRERVVGKQEILDAVWNGDLVSDSAVSRAVARLRSALGDDARRPRYVATVHGRGFRFVAEVEEETACSEEEEVLRREAEPAAPPGLKVSPRSVAFSAGLASLVALLVLLAVVRLSPDQRAGRNEPSTPQPDAKRVAVLPIENLGQKVSDDYFARGLTDQVTSLLTRIEGVRVVGRATLRASGGDSHATEAVLRELGVGSLVEGTVRRSQERLRVTVRLIDVTTQEHLWTQEYDRTLDDWFEVQSEIALRVAQALDATISSDSIAKIRQGPTRRFDAYDFYLRGLDASRRYTRPGNEEAIEHFRRALEIDPQFALAKAGLANAYGLRVVRFGSEQRWIEEAARLAREALALDPNLPETYRALAIVAFFEDRLDEALAYNEKALELDPDNHEALFNGAWTAWLLGQWDKSLRYRLRNLGPVMGRAGLATDLMVLGFHDEGRFLAEQVLSEDPTNSYLLSYLIVRDAEEGRLEEARAKAAILQRAEPGWSRPWALEGLTELYDDDPGAALPLFEQAVALRARSPELRFRLAQTRLVLGDREPALDALSEIEAECREKIEQGAELSDYPWLLAAIHSLRGERGAALEWYQKAVDAGHRYYRSDLVEPAFALLRDEPAFRGQVLRMEQEIAAARRRVQPEVREWWARFRAA